MKTFVAFASAAALLSTAPLALAKSSEPVTVRVGYGDLDLSRAAGRTMLEERIHRAIDRVCGTRPSPPELGAFNRYRACKGASWDGVKPQLAQIYGGRQLADSAVRVIASR